MDTYVAAILTDMHGNKDALYSIIRHIDSLSGKVQKLFFLGDAFGYGSGKEQIQCFDDLLKNSDVFLPGNHEKMALTLLLNPEERVNLIKKGVKKRAVESIEDAIHELIGEQTITVENQEVILPEEVFANMRSENYAKTIAREIIAKTISDFTVSSPEIGKIKKQIPQEIMQQIGSAYLVRLITQNLHILEEYNARLQRREKAIKIYTALREIQKQPKFEGIENAVFVHDDPIQAGSQKYLIDDDTALKLSLEAPDRVILARINKRNLPGIDYVFVGHSHAKAKIIDINGINVVCCGGAEPRGDNPENTVGYVLAKIKENKIIQAVPANIPLLEK